MTPGGRTRILFIRSVPMPAAVAAVAWLRGRWPAANLTVLTSETSRADLTATGCVDHAVIHRARRFGLWAAGPRLLVALRRGRFDAIVVPHTGLPDACWNVARLALAVGGGKSLWLRCAPDQPHSLAAISLRASAIAWWRSSMVHRLLRRGTLHASVAVVYLGGVCLLGILAALLALNLLLARASRDTSA